MKTKTIIQCLGLLCLSLVVLSFTGMFDVAAMNVLPSMAAIGVAGYYDASGAFRGSTGALAAATGTVAGGGGNCAGNGKGNYTFPAQFTLTVTTVGITSVKFTQSDNMTEAAIGSIGTQWFSVQQLPFGAGTIAKQDGTNIFGAETLAASLQTYGIKVGKIIATGTAIAGLSSLIINTWRGNLNGAQQNDITLDMDPTQPNPTASLQWIGSLDLTSNISFRVASLPAASTLNLTFYNVGVIPYI